MAKYRFKYRLKKKYRRKLVQITMLSGLIVASNVIIKNVDFSSDKQAEAEKPKTETAEFSALSTEKAPEPQVFVYQKDIAMPYEHQRYLFDRSLELDLDYYKLLALIETESGFDYKAIGTTDDYGYFQINKMNHEDLAKKLSTPNEPLNPFINIEWGTYILADLYEYWSGEGYKGKELDRLVWSSYNKGITGHLENGPAETYVSKIETNLGKLKK